MTLAEWYVRGRHVQLWISVSLVVGLEIDKLGFTWRLGPLALTCYVA